MLTNIRELQKRIHKLNHRWWHDEAGNRLERNKGELLCLIHSEISEATEGVLTNAMDDHLPHRRMDEVEMADAAIRICDYAEGFGYDLESKFWPMAAANELPDTTVYFTELEWHAQIHLEISRAMEAERKSTGEAVRHLALALYWIHEFTVTWDYDLPGAIEEKLAYNQQRQDHTYAARAQAGGKKW